VSGFGALWSIFRACRHPARRTPRLVATATFALVFVGDPDAVRADQALAAVPPPDAEAAAARGASLWAQSGCTGCHVGTDGIPAIKELAGLSSRYSVLSLADYLRAPRVPMPAITFTDADREALALYLLQTHP